MSAMNSPLRDLPSAEWNELDRLLREFERSWQSGHRPALKEFLRAAPTALALVELIHLDLEYRLAEGESVRVESYLAEYPELSGNSATVVELLAAEFALRRKREPRLSPDEYFARFPSHRDELAKRLPGPATPLPEPRGVANVYEADLIRRFQEIGALVTPSPTEPSGATLPDGKAGCEAAIPEEIGRFGEYRILGVLGCGGMGVVFEAEDPILQRRVALKVINPNLASPEVRARFLQEARAVAAVEHDHIVTIHQVGEVDGLPFLTMPLLRGSTLEERLRRDGRVGIAAALRIGREIAEGLEAAHARGIVHRDVKPANVWLEGDRGRVKLLDFGLARAGSATENPLPGDWPVVDSEWRTQPGTVMGTPGYMAPEQVEGKGAGPAADLFSLGCVLYRLITGTEPFTGENAAERLVATVSYLPRPPIDVDPAVPRRLSELIMWLLARAPTERPASAGATVDELRAIETARAPRRWPLVVTALLLVSAAVAGASYHWASSRGKADTDAVSPPQMDPAVAAMANLSGPAKALACLDHGISLCEKGEAHQGILWLARAVSLSGDGADEAGHAARTNLDAWSSLSPSLAHILRPGERAGPILATAVSPDGKLVAAASGADGPSFVQLWDADTGRPLGSRMAHKSPVTSLAFRQDGRFLITGCDDRVARVWEVPSGRLVHSLAPHNDRVTAVTFSANGETVLTAAADGKVRMWGTVSGQPLGPTLTHPAAVLALGVFDDGETLLTCAADDRVRRWTLSTAEQVHAVVAPSASFAVISPDVRLVLIGGKDGQARLWDTSTQQTREPLPARLDRVTSAVFDPVGKHLLTASADGAARLWDVTTGRSAGPALRHGSTIRAAAIGPDGAVVTGGDDGFLRVWRPGAAAAEGSPFSTSGSVLSVAFRANGKVLVTGSGNPVTASGHAQLWDVGTRQRRGNRFVHPEPVLSVALSPDGGKLLTGSGYPYRARGTGRLWDVATGKQIGKELAQPEKAQVVAVAFSPDGKTAYTAGVQVGGDALNANKGEARAWDVATGTLLGGFGADITSFAFTPDGSILVTGGGDWRARFWRVANRVPLDAEIQTASDIIGVALSPDGRLLLTGCNNGKAQLWRFDTLLPVGRPFVHQSFVRGVAFAPNGRLLLTTSNDTTARLWDVRTHRPVGPVYRHAHGVSSGAFSPDGTTFVTGSGSMFLPVGDARLWRTPRPVGGDAERLALWAQVVTGMELDDVAGPRVLSSSAWLRAKGRLDQFGRSADE